MLPLSGRRILVTRPAGQVSKLAALLEERGAEVVSIPAIEIAPPLSWCGLDAALITLNTFDYVIFTSANAVRAFAQRARRLGLAPAAKTIATIGAATRGAVAEEGIAGVCLETPKRAVAESLTAQLVPLAPEKSMLLVRAETARELLPETLVAAGAQLTIAVAYRNVVPKNSAALLQAAFLQGIDAVTFTSASTVQNLLALMDEAGVLMPPSAVLASIGPITSDALREKGFVATVEAERATTDALAVALAEHFCRTGKA